MPLNNPAYLERDITTPVVFQINTLTRVTDHVASARVFIRPVPHKLGKIGAVVWRHPLWVGHVASNALGYTHLVQLQIRITCNDCTCGKVDTFTH